MPLTIKHAKHGLVTMKMMLEVARVFGSAYMKGNRFGTDSSDLILLGSIFIGHAERKPMNPSKLAEFAGLPRATVIRKLRALEMRKIIERNGATYSVKRSVFSGDEMAKATVKARKLILHAATELSKVDS